MMRMQSEIVDCFFKGKCMSSVKSKLMIGELKFSLYRRLIHPELFTIYARQQHVGEHYELEVWITGCSHVVSVVAGDKVFTELVAGPGQELPSGGLVERFGLDCNQDRRCILNRSLGYMSVLSTEMMTDKMYAKSLKSFEKAAQKNTQGVSFAGDDRQRCCTKKIGPRIDTEFKSVRWDRGMFVRFPKSAVSGLEPFSFVDFDATREQLNVRSYHAYPDQSVVLKMQSRIGLPR